MREFRSQERKGVMGLGGPAKREASPSQNSHLQPARQRSAIPKPSPWTAAPPGGILSS